MNSYEIMLVDRNLMFREGLSLMLDATRFRVGVEAADLKEAAARLDEGAAPALALVEWPEDAAPGRALELLAPLADRLPLVVMSDDLQRDRLLEVLAAGARGFLIKNISVRVLSQYLSLVLLGEMVLPTALAHSLLGDGAGLAGLAGRAAKDNVRLSDDELMILRCLLEGESNKEIANRLDLTENRVKIQLKTILRKISARNRTQAALWAMARGLGPLAERREPRAPSVEVPPQARLRMDQSKGFSAPSRL